MYGGTLGYYYCFGLEQLPAKGDTVFITGGEKDVMTLTARGLHSICFNSETVNIPTNIIYKLTFCFKHIVLLYDTDKTGMESSKKHEKQLSEYGVKRLLLQSLFFFDYMRISGGEGVKFPFKLFCLSQIRHFFYASFHRIGRFRFEGNQGVGLRKNKIFIITGGLILFFR